MRRTGSIIISLFITLIAMSQEKILLYPDGAAETNGLLVHESYRNNEFIVNISEPRMVAFHAPEDIANGTAVIICPGGAYAGVAHIKEGDEIAKWFNKLGVTAFVLYYRMPNGHDKIPLEDAQAALAIVHKRADEWKINRKMIGIMGFSAGGHLASTVGTHFKTEIERPAFMILGYPVVTMDQTYTHSGSRLNLLGDNPSVDLVKLYSNELQVTKRTPPTFIVHAIDDDMVPIANSRNLYKVLKNNGVSAELQEYDKGGHGFGMRKTNIPADNWPEVLKRWLISQKLIEQQ